MSNIADDLRQRAAEAPERIAMYFPHGGSWFRPLRYQAMSYAELDAESDIIARGLIEIGLGQGKRSALMVRPGPAFFVLMFALFKAGAVPVLIDPGIDKRALKQCLDEAKPHGFIGITLAHIARTILGWAQSASTLVTVGAVVGWGGYGYQQLRALGLKSAAVLPQTSADTIAAILFTSGSTGVPKGVEYTHANFRAQIDLIRSGLDFRAGEIDLPTFPPFALFDPALGATSVIPQMDPTRPAKADPRKLVAAIERFGVTTLFGSPALVKVLAEYGERSGVKLATLKRVISAGAPVAPELVASLQKMLPSDANIWTPYGATECLPVSLIEGREILNYAAEKTRNGAGICIGKPLAENLVRIICIDDGAIPQWHAGLELPIGEIGEISVHGPSTTSRYFGRDQATALAKIPEGNHVVHRMGDVGYFDDNGYLWYLGRKSHRVQTASGTLYSEVVEAWFNQHPAVARSALVGVGAAPKQTPIVCIELNSGFSKTAFAKITVELIARAQQSQRFSQIEYFFAHPRFPVDIRHNAKISREILAVWAAKRMPD